MLSDKLVQEYKEIFKKEYGQDLTDSEARDQAQRLTGFFEILYNQAVIEHRRKLRLKKEKVRGFYLEPTEGPYTCGICGDNYQGNDIWWNTKGLRCRDCWNNIKKKVIPALTYDSDNKVWIKEWQLQYDYNLHPATRNKLRRQGLLRGRDLKREDGSTYCTVYLVKENKEFLKRYPKKPSMEVKFTNINNIKAKTTYPTKKELVDIYERDKRCVYCGKKFDKTQEKDKPTIEHLNHKQDWDSVSEYRREGKPVSEIVAICCMACNRNRGSKSLRKWFGSKYCIDNGISYQMVTEVVREYIDKYEKE